ncbi:MAG TPA: hypothetical protein VL738_34440 [Dactylosporangium sp.]|jgi:hypothetical protein|nr:hypothetical protein [Dactylosporangium sp.]
MSVVILAIGSTPCDTRSTQSNTAPNDGAIIPPHTVHAATDPIDTRHPKPLSTGPGFTTQRNTTTWRFDS